MDNPDQECLARLREAEVQPGFVAQLQATLNVNPAHTWYAAPSGDLTFVNIRTADYLGLPKDHPLRFGIDIGAQWDAHIPLLHPDDCISVHLARRAGGILNFLQAFIHRT